MATRWPLAMDPGTAAGFLIPKRLQIETIYGCNASRDVRAEGIRSLCASGPMPEELFRKIVDEMTPYLAQIEKVDLFGLGRAAPRQARLRSHPLHKGARFQEPRDLDQCTAAHRGQPGQAARDAHRDRHPEHRRHVEGDLRSDPPRAHVRAGRGEHARAHPPARRRRVSDAVRDPLHPSRQQHPSVARVQGALGGRAVAG